MSKGSKQRQGTGYAEGYDAIDWGRKEDAPEGQQRTGWPPGLLQDDSYQLAHALSSKPDARQHVRDVAAQIAAEKADAIVFADEESLEKVCKNWLPEPLGSRNECKHQQVTAMCEGQYAEMGSFVTTADFGCNRWASKQP